MTAPEKVFLDSNISLYLIDKSSNQKKLQVEGFLSSNFLISTQVIAENVSVCLKKLKIDKKEAFAFASALMRRFKVVVITPEILTESFDISLKYQLSSWDSIIIATALHYECTILYSEDMQDGLVIENQTKIVNPFKL
jgi:predicted nucleic acid-binding protein